MPYYLGKSVANIVKYEDKKIVLNYLFKSINLSNYRFQMLNNLDQLDFLKKNEHFVSPNFYGKNFLMIFMKINNLNKTFLIDRKKLKYNFDDINLKTLLILEVNIDCDNSVYNGTIIDGKILKLEKNYIYIINDCYNLYGSNLKSQPLEMKYKTLNTLLSKQMATKPCLNFDIKINKLYEYIELDNLIHKIIPKTNLPINGIVFYPKYSGNIIIYSDNKNNKNSTPETNFKINNNITSDESYHIVRDLCLYLKSRTKIKFTEFENIKYKELFLRKTDMPDVYYLQENKESSQIGIAHIPNLTLSQKLDTIFENIIIKKFNCYYDTHFKKWVPML